MVLKKEAGDPAKSLGPIVMFGEMGLTDVNGVGQGLQLSDNFFFQDDVNSAVSVHADDVRTGEDVANTKFSAKDEYIKLVDHGASGSFGINSDVSGFIANNDVSLSVLLRWYGDDPGRMQSGDVHKEVTHGSTSTVMGKSTVGSDTLTYFKDNVTMDSRFRRPQILNFNTLSQDVSAVHNDFSKFLKSNIVRDVLPSKKSATHDPVIPLVFVNDLCDNPVSLNSDICYSDISGMGSFSRRGNLMGNQTRNIEQFRSKVKKFLTHNHGVRAQYEILAPNGEPIGDQGGWTSEDPVSNPRGPYDISGGYSVKNPFKTDLSTNRPSFVFNDVLSENASGADASKPDDNINGDNIMNVQLQIPQSNVLKREGGTPSAIIIQVL